MKKILSAILVLGSSASLSGCSTSSTGEYINQGYVINQDDINSIRVGSSLKQVMLALGTPTLRATFENKPVYYYISQTKYRPALFMNPTTIDRTIYAIYFDTKQHVVKVAKYGLEQGKVVDYLNYETPTAYQSDNNLLLKLFSGSKFNAAKSLFGNESK